MPTTLRLLAAASATALLAACASSPGEAPDSPILAAGETYGAYAADYERAVETQRRATRDIREAQKDLDDARDELKDIEDRFEKRQRDVRRASDRLEAAQRRLREAEQLQARVEREFRTSTLGSVERR